jgi:Hsp20/alpha crystallin family
VPSLRVGAGTPAINVAETKDAMEVTIEVPGVDEKDIKVSLNGNQLVISGEKKEETKKDEKDWHVEERSYGSFYRSMSLPFKPEEGAVEAHLRFAWRLQQCARIRSRRHSRPTATIGDWLGNYQERLSLLTPSGRTSRTTVRRGVQRARNR